MRNWITGVWFGGRTPRGGRSLGTGTTQYWNEIRLTGGYGVGSGRDRHAGLAGSESDIYVLVLLLRIERREPVSDSVEKEIGEWTD